MKAIAVALLLTISQHSYALTPTDCDAIKPVAGKALDLINKVRRDGYLFQLLRVADAHLDKAESPAVYYLVLDVQESDCSVLSRKHWDECGPAFSRHPSEIVIGQCKVIATTRSNESQDLRVKDFNCTTSSVFSALANTKDSPVLIDFFEDTEPYRKQADEALEKYKKENDDFASFKVDQVERVARGRGGKRTNYYLDFSVRNCSRHHFPRHFNIFGFCKALFSYAVEASDLETPKDLEVNCEVFNPEERRNFSGGEPHSGDSRPFKPDGSRDGPCDPPEHSKDPHDHHRPGHSPPPGHSEERGPDKRHFPFHWRHIGYVYRLPPLKKGEVLPPPEANFPSFSSPNHSKPLKPEIQPFPQSASESCPGKFTNEFPQILKFFA